MIQYTPCFPLEIKKHIDPIQLFRLAKKKKDLCKGGNCLQIINQVLPWIIL